jgi:diguanylate cyclase (GGDEF)-like protein/PAS domain S-box-containing protein
VALKIRQCLELKDILQTTVEQVQALLQSDRVLVYRFEPDWSGIVVAEALSQPQWSILSHVVHDPCFETSWLEPYTEQRYFAVEDVTQAALTPCHRDFLRDFQVQANLVVPILCRSDLWGLLIAHHCCEPRPWPRVEIEALQEIAVHVGIAVTQATLLQELQTANAKLTTDLDQRQTELVATNQALQEEVRRCQATADALVEHQDQLRGFATIVESSNDAIISKTLDGIVTSWNRAAAALFGYSAGEMIGQSIERIIPPERRTEAQVIREALGQGQRVEPYETWRRNQDGHRIDVVMTESALRNHEHQIVGISVIFRDITDQKQAELRRRTTEQALTESEQRLQLALSASGDGLWDWNIETGTVFFSDRWMTMLGFEPDELPPTLDIWQDLVHPADWPWVSARLEAHLEDSSLPYQFDYRLRTKAGGWKWVANYGRVVAWTEAGAPMRMTGTHRDINEHKRFEERLRDSEATNRALVQAIPDFLVRMRCDGLQLEVINPGRIQVIAPDGHGINQNIQDFMPLAVAQERLRLADLAIASQQVQSHVYSLVMNDALRYEEARIVPFRDNEVLVMVRDITQERGAEQRLQQTKEQLELVLEASSEGFWDWNLTTQEIYFSPRWKEMLGYADDELDNTLEMWESVIDEGDRHAALQFIEDYNHGRVDRFEMVQRFHHKNGSTVFILSRAIHLKDAEGRVVRMVGSHLDVTNSHRQELALQESEARYRHIIETTLEGVWILDETGKTTFVNRQMADMLGYSKAELLERSFLDFIDPDGRAQAEAYFDQRRQGIQEQHSFCFQRRDGTVLWTLISATPLVDANGQYQGVIGLLTDITPLYEIQAALQVSQGQLSGILDSSLDGIMAFRSVRDDQGQIIDFEWTLSNPKACEIVGHTQGDLIGQRMLTKLPGNREEGLFDLYVQVVESGQPAQRTFYYNHDGIDCWFENVAVRLNDGFAVTFRDITQNKLTEQQLQLANNKLQEVNQRLGTHVEDLEQRNQEMLLLSRTSDFLQACQTIPEACAVISTLVQPLFPDCVGEIYITSASRNRLQQMAQWGLSLNSAVKDFEPHDCWGLRRGRLHGVNAQSAGLRCQHNHRLPPTVSSLCIPMIAQGETLGLFHLQSVPDVPLSESRQQLAQTVAEQIGLAIANLHLRETLQHQSIRDPLTGLFNRRYLEEVLEREVVRAQRNQGQLGVIMLDVDHFKRFNDTYGHDAGDLVLQAIGQLLRNHMRGSDVACRYGGEELTIVLSDIGLTETQKRAEEIRKAIAHLHIPMQGAVLGDITASLGVASFPAHGVTGTSLIKAADEALYRAKAAGRNQVLVAT